MSEVIDDVLRQRRALYCRHQRRRSKEAAVNSERYLLGKYDYDWNIKDNVEDE